jgi:hypothetical protein
MFEVKNNPNAQVWAPPVLTVAGSLPSNIAGFFPCVLK